MVELCTLAVHAKEVWDHRPGQRRHQHHTAQVKEGRRHLVGEETEHIQVTQSKMCLKN